MSATQRRACLLFVLAFTIYALPLVYNALVTPFFHVIPSQDVVSASLVPASVLTRGNFYLDQYRRYIANNYAEQHFAADLNGHLVSITPIVSGILTLPLVGVGIGTGWIARTAYIFDVAKLGAMFLAALAVLAFFYAARRLTDLSTATLVTIAFAFGSSAWATASQGLWQHTPSILFQSIALGFLIRGIRRGGKGLAPAGLFLSLATISRPPVLVIALVWAVFVFAFYRPQAAGFILAAIPPLALALWYNAAVNGSPLVFGYQEGVAQFFGLPTWEAIQGLLFSTGRGIFIYSPFLLLAPIGLWFGWIRERQPFYLFLALAFVAYLLVMAAWGSLGGWAYGARMLTDTLPVMCLLIIPAVERIRGPARGAVWATVVLAAFVQSFGIYDYGNSFHADASNSVWSLENSEPVFYLKLYLGMIQEALGL